MNRTIFHLVAAALLVSLAGCERRPPPRRSPVPGPGPDAGTTYLEQEPPDTEPVEPKKKNDEVVDPTPVQPKEKIPPPPTVNNPEYGIKIDGKPGIVKSPYDGQGRPVDVRGLPPGTEVECPYTRRTFLVPP